MKRGKFITFEGCEGSGKSTQLKLLSDYLSERGVDFILTREPGGSEVAEKIRSIILDGKNEAMTAECEALLYAAARVQHLQEIVAPALERGTLVVCDRFVDSSFAYQGYARGLGTKFIAEINAFAIENFRPDLTLFLDLPPRAAFERKHGADENDRMEKLGLEFHEKVYLGYRQLLAENSHMRAIECGGTKYETAENVRKVLRERGIID